MPKKLDTAAIFEARATLNVCAAEFGSRLKGTEIATGKAGDPLGAVAIFRDTSNDAAALAVAGIAKTNPQA